MRAVKTNKCTEHPAEDAIHVDLWTNNALCVPCTLDYRREQIKGKAPVTVKKLSDIEVKLPPGRHAAKICFQVLAGLVPGTPLPEFTEEWWISGDQWEAINTNPEMHPEHHDNLFVRYQDEARWYAERITDPHVINWVRVEFIYF